MALVITGVNTLRKAFHKKEREIKHIIEASINRASKQLPYIESEIKCMDGTAVVCNKGGVKPAVYMGG